MTTYISIQCDCHKDVPRCHRKRCILILFLRKHTSETKIWYSFSEWGHIFPKHNQCYTMQPRFHAMYTLSFYFFERERKKRRFYITYSFQFHLQKESIQTKIQTTSRDFAKHDQGFITYALWFYFWKKTRKQRFHTMPCYRVSRFHIAYGLLSMFS